MGRRVPAISMAVWVALTLLLTNAQPAVVCAAAEDSTKIEVTSWQCVDYGCYFRQPLAGVFVAVYGSNDPGNWGSLLHSGATGANHEVDFWLTPSESAAWRYFNVVQSDLPNYVAHHNAGTGSQVTLHWHQIDKQTDYPCGYIWDVQMHPIWASSPTRTATAPQRPR